MASALDLESTRLVLPLQKLATKFCLLGDLSTLERFVAYIQSPCVPKTACIIFPRAEAILSAKNLSGPAIFTDSSARNSLVGIGIHNLNITHFPVSSNKVVTSHTLNVFTDELLAIDVLAIDVLAIDVALAQLSFLPNVEQPWRHQNVTLFIDSQSALNALNFPRAQSGQFLVKSISLKIHQLRSRGISCVFQRSLGYSKIPANTKVYKLTQLAMLPSCSTLSFTNPILLYSIAKQEAHQKSAAPDSKIEFIKAKVGKHQDIFYNWQTKKQS